MRGRWVSTSFCYWDVWPFNRDPDWTKVTTFTWLKFYGPRSLINPSGGSSGGGVISLGRAGDTNKVYHTCTMCKCAMHMFQINWCGLFIDLCYAIGGLQCYLSLYPRLWRASAGQQRMGVPEYGQCQHQAGGAGEMKIDMWWFSTGICARWLVSRQYLGCLGSQNKHPAWLQKTGEVKPALTKISWHLMHFFSREDNLIWFSRDVPALAKKLRTLPILFDLDLASSQEAAHFGNKSESENHL